MPNHQHTGTNRNSVGVVIEPINITTDVIDLLIRQLNHGWKPEAALANFSRNRVISRFIIGRLTIDWRVHNSGSNASTFQVQ